MIAWTFLFSFINSNYPLVAQRKKSFPRLGLNLLTTCMVWSTDLWTNSWLLDWYLCFVQSRTKRLGQRASSPLRPLTMLIIGWFFLFLLEETWYFPTLIRVCNPAQLSQILLSGIVWKSYPRNFLEKRWHQWLR